MVCDGSPHLRGKTQCLVDQTSGDARTPRGAARPTRSVPPGEDHLPFLHRDPVAKHRNSADFGSESFFQSHVTGNRIAAVLPLLQLRRQCSRASSVSNLCATSGLLPRRAADAGIVRRASSAHSASSRGPERPLKPLTNFQLAGSVCALTQFDSALSGRPQTSLFENRPENPSITACESCFV